MRQLITLKCATLTFAALLLCGCGGSQSDSTSKSSGGVPKTQISIHNFRGGADGSSPFGLILDGAGNLYGTTTQEGDLSCPDSPLGCGTVFKIDATGAFTTIHIFKGGPNDGAVPQSGLILDSAGNLYGATFAGGAHRSGTVFKIDSAGALTVLHDFNAASDGFAPELGVQDAAGNFYGTTGFNPPHDTGSVFRLDPAGNLITLHQFSGSDGDNPAGPLIADSAGNLYGTTFFGGNNSACIDIRGCGTVFEVDANGTFKTLYAFTGKEVEGAHPSGRLARDASGNLFGTATYEGPTLGGAVFRLDNNNQMTSLHTFICTNFCDPGNDPGGQYPSGGLILDAVGNLYGTTSEGGTLAWGVVFRMDQTGAETVLHTFSQAEGGTPVGPVVQDSAGNLFGTASEGGDPACLPVGCGIVFELKAPLKIHRTAK